MYTVQYYDLVLLGVAVSVAAGTGVGVVTDVSFMVSVVAACLLALVLIGHGLFVNGPVDAPADLTDEVDALH